MITQHNVSFRLKTKIRKTLDESYAKTQKEIVISLWNTRTLNHLLSARKDKKRNNRGNRKREYKKHWFQKINSKIKKFLKKHRNFLEKTFMVLLEIAIRIIRNLI